MKRNFLFFSLISLFLGCQSTKEVNVNDFSSIDNPVINHYAPHPNGQFPSYNPHFPPPSGAKQVFELSQDYPKEVIKEDYPWLNIDFKTEPDNYINTLFAYCLEGNIDVEFKVQDNPVRKWYHAPWLHADGKKDKNKPSNFNGNGREYNRGLTRERPTPIGEIHPKQDVMLENWAVGFYNNPGGYNLGKAWLTGSGVPTLDGAVFPEGTVSFKLLFTSGTTDKVPFLENTYEWTANIYDCNPEKDTLTCFTRVNKTVRLLQVDVAVKDSRSSKTGWVFGTFIYDATAPGETPFERLVPVGLSWGDDSDITTDINKEGAFVNKELKESYLNAYLIQDPKKTYPESRALMLAHGLGGRLNGPVDNPISSCISCHGHAGYVSADGSMLPMANFAETRANFTSKDFKTYFSTIPPAPHIRKDAEGKEYQSTDYSLQLAAGIRNYHYSKNHKEAILAHAKDNNKDLETYTKEEVAGIKSFVKDLPAVTRGH